MLPAHLQMTDEAEQEIVITVINWTQCYKQI